MADHRRGDAPQEWKSQGVKIEGAESAWRGVLGPDSPALGERADTEPLTLAQVAATLAAAVDENHCAAVRSAARAIPEVLGRTPAQKP